MSRICVRDRDVRRMRAPMASVLPAEPCSRNHERVRTIAAVIAQQLSGLAIVGHQHIEIAVVVDVTGCQPPPHPSSRQTRAPTSGPPP